MTSSGAAAATETATVNLWPLIILSWFGWAGTLVAVAVAGSLGDGPGVDRAAVERATHPGMLLLVLGVSLWLFAARLQEKDTFPPVSRIEDRRARRRARLGYAMLVPFVFAATVILITLGIGGPVTALIWSALDAGFSGEPRLGWPAALVALCGLCSLWGGLSALSRSLRLFEFGRLLRNLPTSRIRSAAAGLVEIHGTAHALEGEDRPVLLGYHEDTSCFLSEPFVVEDETGRARVEPPPQEVRDARFALRGHAEHGWQALMPGDEVFVVGTLDPSGPEPAVRPWISPHAGPLDRLFRAAGRVARRLRLFGVPSLFLVAHGDREREARRRVLRERLWWLAYALVLLLGGTVLTAVGGSRVGGLFLIERVLG